jgi:tRNA(fMet)-specific endonuclease VapC
VDRRLKKATEGHVIVSVITEAELRFGLARLPGALRLQPLVEEFLLNVDILPWDSSAAREYGTLRALLERQGTRMANLDMMIGAHALSMGAVLVTNDHAFQRIKNLKLADWTKP